MRPNRGGSTTQIESSVLCSMGASVKYICRVNPSREACRCFGRAFSGRGDLTAQCAQALTVLYCTPNRTLNIVITLIHELMKNSDYTMYLLIKLKNSYDYISSID